MWKQGSGDHKVGSSDLWDRPTPYGPHPPVLSHGGYQVGPQVSSRCPHGLEVVWTL
jgi:hypothetical protein